MRKKANNKQRRMYLLAAILIALIPFIYGATISGWHQLVYGGDFSLNATSLNFYTFNQSRLFISNGGLVGIGTTSPNNRLDVVGPASEFNFSGTEPLGFLVRGSTGSGTDLSGIDFAGAGYTIPLARIAVNSTGSGTFLSLGTSNVYVSGITNKALTIDPSGFVGIGDPTPDEELKVVGGLCVGDSADDTCSTTSGEIDADGAINANNFDIAERFYTENNESIEPGSVVALTSVILEQESLGELAGIEKENVEELQEAFQINDTSILLEKIENNDTQELEKDVAKHFEKIKEKLAEKDENGVSGKDRILASKSAAVKVAESAYDSKTIGVVSAEPAFVMGFSGGLREGSSVPVAVAGRVPVKVSAENGNIAVGDPLTSSSTPGYAMKATRSGRIIGYALEEYEGNNEKILVFINAGWYQVPQDMGSGNISIGQLGIFQYNSSCAGFRFGSSGGMVLSCS